MKIGLCGVDHTQTSIKDLEPIFLNKDGKEQFLKRLSPNCPVQELVILTTCNRVEFYFCAEDLDKGMDWIVSQLSIQKNINETSIRELLVLKNEAFTIRHLFEVASGVQSMVFGENEILSQVKDAYEVASEKKATASFLNKFFQTSVSVGKRSRAETEISKGAYSVSSIAVDAIRQKKLDYFGRSILIIGCGVMGKRCLVKLDALGHPDMTIANRTHQIAVDLSTQYGVSHLSYEKALTQIDSFEIIISATSTKKAIITKTHISEKENNDKLFIDLGLPRNVEPAIDDMNGVDVINVDGLKLIADKNIQRRRGEVEKVKLIIQEEIDRFFQWMQFKKNQCHAI